MLFCVIGLPGSLRDSERLSFGYCRIKGCFEARSTNRRLLEGMIPNKSNCNIELHGLSKDIAALLRKLKLGVDLVDSTSDF